MPGKKNLFKLKRSSSTPNISSVSETTKLNSRMAGELMPWAMSGFSFKLNES
jgi:hypothetical protein